MRLNNKLFLLANLLAVNSHFVKRDFYNSQKIEVYKNIVPTSLEQIVRDATNTNRLYKLVKSTIDVSEPLVNINQGKYIKSPLDDPFNLLVKCYTEQDCADYPEAVQKGAYYIANTLEFYTSVNVNVTIFPFCNYMTDLGSCESIMGITYPPTFIPLKESEDSEEFLYPQALVKQLNLDSQIDYDDIDFQIYLNSNYKPDADHDNRSLIAAHEILHGLGFFHQINPVSVYINNYKSICKEDFAVPPIQFVQSGDVVKYQGWSPFSIFDKFIVSTSAPDDYLYLKLEKFKNHDISFEVNIDKTTQKQYYDFVNTFKELSDDIEAKPGGVEVAELFKTLNAVGFRTSDGSVVELQTFDGTYESASSISHTNVPFACKNSGTCTTAGKTIEENYLMYFTVINKSSTNKLISNFKDKSKHDLVGPNIIKIMTTLGWNERNGEASSANDNKYSVSTDAYHQSSGAQHLTYSMMIILSFILLCISYLI